MPVSLLLIASNRNPGGTITAPPTVSILYPCPPPPSPLPLASKTAVCLFLKHLTLLMQTERKRGIFYQSSQCLHILSNVLLSSTHHAGNWDMFK